MDVVVHEYILNTCSHVFYSSEIEFQDGIMETLHVVDDAHSGKSHVNVKHGQTSNYIWRCARAHQYRYGWCHGGRRVYPERDRERASS